MRKLHNPKKMFVEAFISLLERSKPVGDARRFATDVNTSHVAPGGKRQLRNAYNFTKLDRQKLAVRYLRRPGRLELAVYAKS